MATFIELFLENSLRRLVRRKIDQKNFILYQQIRYTNIQFQSPRHGWQNKREEENKHKKSVTT